jgi:uncharacterized membrane protein
MPMTMRELRKRTTIEVRMRESNHAFAREGLYSYAMLFLAAFARIIPAEPEPNDLIAQPNAAMGHLGLTVIALVFVLLTFWKA